MSIIFSSLFLIILTTNLYSIGFIFLNEKKNNLGLAQIYYLDLQF